MEERKHVAKIKKPHISIKGILVFFMLLAILAISALYAVTHFEGVSFYGDDPNYTWLASAFQKGFFQINPGYIFTLRPMSFIPIAAMYALFGANAFTSTLWNIICYLGIIVVAYLFGRHFYDAAAGLFAAALAAIFPMLTKFAVNIGVDVPLTFIGSLSVLFFLYGVKGNKWYWYMLSGMLLVITFFIDYEGGIFCVFVPLYALILIISKKITINKSTIFFIYGIAILLLLFFIFSELNVHKPFVLITGNLNFYSFVGIHNGTTVTIPTANTNLAFYIQEMFPYNIVKSILSGNFIGNVNTILFSPVDSNETGLYFYIFVIALAFLLISREKRSYFLMAWFAFEFLLLEFGPMSVISFNPLSIHYTLAHRLTRFLMITTVPLVALIGIAFAKVVERKRFASKIIASAFIAAIFFSLIANSYNVTSYYYYWVMYPSSAIKQAGQYLSAKNYSQIYLENVLTVNYGAIMLPIYLGDPSTNKLDFSITNATNCSTFSTGSYVIWSGMKKCSNWINVFNITVSGIPSYIINAEKPMLPYFPTNIYYVSSQNGMQQ